MYVYVAPLLLLFLRSADSVIIETTNGLLNGAKFRTNKGQLVHAFKHVPFAAAPVGALRYSLPQAADSWKGVRNAKAYGPACPSNSTQSSSPQKWVDEDCLHVNIFVSDRCLKSQCPVVFYIHGGGLNYDSAVMFDDESLVNNFGAKDVVLVITAFRLGFSGHLTFSDEKITPTNLALYDLIQCLKWVQSNVHSFGGDSQDVTLLGHSDGASLVLLFTFSKNIDPHRKLFHKSIAMSPFVHFGDELSLAEMTRKFAHRAGCMPYNVTLRMSDNYKREVLECLRTKTGDHLLRVQRQLEEEEGLVPASVVLAPPLFTEKDVRELLRSPTPRPLLTGVISKEMDGYWLDEPVTHADLQGYRNPIAVGNKYISDHKLGKIEFNHSTETQATFLCALNYAEQISKTGQKSYLYEYANPTHPYHSNDLYYLMGTHPFEKTENEQHLEDLYLNYFISFIKTGKPAKDWRPFKSGLNNYFNIDYDTTTGLRPHNLLHFHSDIVSYWRENLREYDEALSRNQSITAVPKELAVTIENESVEVVIAVWKKLLMSGTLILIGFLLGRFFPISRTPTVLLGTPNEKTPLCEQIF